MNIVANIIELFFPFLKATNGALSIVPPVLGLVIFSYPDRLTLKSCEFISKLVDKRGADMNTCEELDIYNLNQAIEMLNDPLLSDECVENTMSVFNKLYKISLVPTFQSTDEVIKTKQEVFEIFDWDMNGLKEFVTPHYQDDISEITAIFLIIRNDNLVQTHSYFFTRTSGILKTIDDTNLTFDITGITDFDDALYSSASIDRGYLYIATNT